MEPQSTINRLKESSVYKEWRKGHKESYLVHCFVMLEGKQKSEWQIGFYIKEHDKIVTFFVGHEIKASPESEILKEDTIILRELDINKVKVDIDKAIEAAIEYQQATYPKEKAQKTIVILQNLEEGIVYNMTLVTGAFNMLNIKVSAEDGSIVSHKLNSLTDMCEVKKGFRKDKNSEYIG